MPSMPPSQFNGQTRTDGGPFVEFLLLDERGIPVETKDEANTVNVYFSDSAQEHANSIGQLVMMVSRESLMMHPINYRAESSNYGKPKYGQLKWIVLPRLVAQPWDLPEDEHQLEELLQSLPVGFSKDWRFGLGLQWEYRFIMEAIASIEGVDCLGISGDFTANHARVEGNLYELGLKRYRAMVEAIKNLSRKHQRETRSDKQLLCYTALLHQASPERFPAKAKRAQQDMLSSLFYSGAGKVSLSKRDRSAAARLVKDNAVEMVKQRPDALLELVADIELITLGELIERFKAHFASRGAENKWQRFLGDNPFILNMAFAYPVKIICERPYVGGKRFSDWGGNYSDFLAAARSSGNTALIEIKHHDTPLHGNVPYRGDTFAASHDLSGAVAQVLEQRSLWQRNFHSLSEGHDSEIFSHSVTAILIIGTTPEGAGQKRSFEQYRHSLRDVTIVTFDELQMRLEDVHRALSPAKYPPPAPAGDDDCPF